MKLVDKQRIINGLIAQKDNQCRDHFYNESAQVCARSAIAREFGLEPLKSKGICEGWVNWHEQLLKIEYDLGLNEMLPIGLVPDVAKALMFKLESVEISVKTVLQVLNDSGLSFPEIAEWVDHNIPVEDPIDTTALETPVEMANA